MGIPVLRYFGLHCRALDNILLVEGTSQTKIKTMNMLAQIDITSPKTMGVAILGLVCTLATMILGRIIQSFRSGSSLKDAVMGVICGTNAPKPPTPPVALVIGLLLLSMSAQAQVPECVATNGTKAALIGFAQGVNQVKAVSVGVYPAYAPDLVVNGEKHVWGVGIAALYPVSQYSFAGLRLDYLGGQFWMPSCTVGLKADMQILGHNVTPFTIGGAIFPVSDAGDRNGQVGAIVGAGITANIWQSDDSKKSLNLFYACEKWTIFDGVIHRPGVAFSFKF